MNDRTVRLMRSALPGLVGIFLLAGCNDFSLNPPPPPPPTKNKVSVVLDYAPTSLGLRNSGLLPAGQLMLWDRSAGTLTDVGVLVPLTVKSESPSTGLQATIEAGIGLRAGFTLSESAKAEAGIAITENLKFAVTDVVRQTISSEPQAVTRAFRAQAADAESDTLSWRIDEVLAAPDRFAYVVLTDPVLAMSETFAFEIDNQKSAELTITDKVQGQITLSLPRNASASCTADSTERVPCFIGVQGLKPVRRADGSIAFQAIDVPHGAIAPAFRAR